MRLKRRNGHKRTRADRRKEAIARAAKSWEQGYYTGHDGVRRMPTLSPMGYDKDGTPNAAH